MEELIAGQKHQRRAEDLEAGDDEPAKKGKV